MGLGIWDKQIDFSKEKAPALASPLVKLTQKVESWKHKFQKLLAQVPEDQKDEVKRKAKILFEAAPAPVVHLKDRKKDSLVVDETIKNAPRRSQRIASKS
jgi:hypothetical protein